MTLRTKATAAVLTGFGFLAVAGCSGTAGGGGDAADHGAIAMIDSGEMADHGGIAMLDGGDVADEGVPPMLDAGDPGDHIAPPVLDAADVADHSAPPVTDGGDAMVGGDSGTLTPMNIYFGTTHMHTGCCNDHGETNHATAMQVFAAARANPTGFDFMFLTEHSGSTGPSSVPMDPAVFYADVQRLAASVTDSTFVGFAGFEYSDNDGGGGLGTGHMTAVNTSDFLSADGPSNAVTVEDDLVRQFAAGRPVYGGFNHPPAAGHPGAAAALLTPQRREVMVMNEVHNSYASDADLAYFDSFIAALDHGWRVAPTCGLDGHGTFRAADTRPEPGPCRTGVLAQALTRGDLDAAFMARRIYSSRDINMRVSYSANGQWMGSQLGHPAMVAFDITVSDPDTTNLMDKITRIEILSEGGTVVTSRTFDAHAVNWRVSVPAGTHRYFTLRIFNGERTTYTAAAAPVWLE